MHDVSAADATLRSPGTALRVLVTNAEARAALAVCRGLREAGHTPIVLSSSVLSAASWSRSRSGSVRVPDPYSSVDSFIAAVEGLVAAGDYDVLFPTTDMALWSISDAREKLEPFVRIGLPSHEVVRAVLDKDRLTDAAARAGVPAPETVLCEDTEAAVAAARELGFPVVLKPRRSLVVDGGSFRKRSATVVDDRVAFERALPSFGMPLLVQRLRSGASVIACGGVFVSERLEGLVVTRWHRRWPPSGGATTFCETITPPAGLGTHVERLLTTLGYHGVFELELLDLGDGEFSAIDLNPRPFGWLALAVRAGANLPAIWCDWLCGRHRPRAHARPGVRYRWDDGEARHLVWQLLHGHFRSAARVMRPHRGVVHAYFELRDPLPLAVEAAAIAARRVRPRRSGVTRRS